jgi:hydrogenase/urease accessory protein HupE
MRRAAALTCLWLLAAGSAGAHPAPFSYLDLRLNEAGIDGSLVVHDLDVAHDVGVDPPERFADPLFAEQYREQLSRLMDSRLALFADGRRTSIAWTGFETLPERQSLRLRFRAGDGRPGRVRVDTVVFPYDPIHQTFLNVYEDGELRHQAILDQQRTTFNYYAGTWQGATAVMAVFIPAGIEHIVIGPDHVLFLVGLLLLGGTAWRLATIVTAFTIGHSVTLSLAALDVIAPPAAIVEPVIALSIVFVGADNLLVLRDRTRVTAGTRETTQPRDIRAWVAGVFGLIHGFGFASVLKEFGLPLTALGWSLFSFNFGVELGQLAIVFVVAAALGTVRRRDPRLARHLVVAGSLVVIAAGAYWFVERVFLARG